MKDNYFLQQEIDSLKQENMKAHDRILDMKKKLEEIEEKMGSLNTGNRFSFN